VGGLSYELSEGDVITFMSQWGEIEDINLIREKDTGKSQGFCFIKYEDQRSTILAVDNFNGITLLGRMLRCDHVDQYKLPKEIREKEEAAIDDDPTRNIAIGPGHAYYGKELQGEYTIDHGINMWEKPSEQRKRQRDSSDMEHRSDDKQKKKHKQKHESKKKKKYSKDRSSVEETEEWDVLPFNEKLPPLPEPIKEIGK
jgi:RNA-binding motif X-linked protein 2